MLEYVMCVGRVAGWALAPQRSEKDGIPRQRGYFWDGGTFFSSVATGKDQIVFRSDARALIKLTSDFAVNGSQGHDSLRDAENLKREETHWIHFLDNKWEMKDWCVQLCSDWARYLGFCILLSLEGSGVEVKMMDSLSSWVVTWPRHWGWGLCVHQIHLDTSLPKTLPNIDGSKSF